ncbi:MAG: hypothetical protein KC620_00695, partial [Myxococcales bacterium]|nr:hypothetical protein [Myxococcales bacterium]
MLTGCPDPEAAADRFLSERPPVPDAAVPEPGCTSRVDRSGTSLLAVNTSLAPGTPLLFDATTVITEGDPWTIKISIQPLSASPERTAVGDPIEPDAVPLAEDGSFTIPFGEVAVTGEANPISGSNILVQFDMMGQVRTTQAVI